jgi:hypothetical protein
MTSKPLTHAEHFGWIQAALADPAFTAAQKVILVRLALHLNLKSGRCDPSIETVARGAAVKTRAVQMTFGKAQRLGYLIRFEGCGRGRTSSYCLVLKEAASRSETLYSGAPFTETVHSQTLNGGAQNGAPPRDKPRTAVHLNTENKKNTDFDRDFERWYSIYPKHRARAKARQAFERIVTTGKSTVAELMRQTTLVTPSRPISVATR